MSNRRTAILTTIGVAVIMLVIDVALGSVAFPVTKTKTTSGSTTCTYKGFEVVACPSNQTFTISVSYGGLWGASYQIYNGMGESIVLTGSGSFYGQASANKSVTVLVNAGGITLCAEAQKLDASSSTLVLRVGGAVNQTSVGYGTAKACTEAVNV